MEMAVVSLHTTKITITVHNMTADRTAQTYRMQQELQIAAEPGALEAPMNLPNHHIIRPV